MVLGSTYVACAGWCGARATQYIRRKNFGLFLPPASKKGRGSGGRNFLLAGGFFLKILRIFRKVGSEFFPEVVLARMNAFGRLAPSGLGEKSCKSGPIFFATELIQYLIQ